MSNNPRVDKGNSRNFFIDAYRMFLILCIMLFHFTYTYNTKDPSIQISYPFVFKNGHIGVSQFFIISGYYMSRLFEQSGGGKMYFEYCAKRYYRLWAPYFIACIFIYLFCHAFPLFYDNIDFNLFLLNLVLFVHPGISYLDGAHWFIGMLFIIELIIGGCVLIINIQKRMRALLVASFIMGLCFWMCHLYGVSITNTYAFSFFFILIGVQLYRILQAHDSKFLIPSIICLGYVVVHNSFYYSIGIAIFVVAIMLNSNVFFKVRIRIGIIESLGGISFCWYLVHHRIGSSIQYHFIPHDDTSGAWILLPVICTLIIALVVYYLSNRIKSILDYKYDTALSKLSEKYFG